MCENLTTERAIESYQPAWLPPRGELQDVIVVINPVGGGAKSAEQRHRDDLALMTGGHLFHLIQAAGGVPVMTRADDRPIPGADAGPDAALGTICAQRNGDLIVSVEFMSRDPARATHCGRVGVLPYVDNALSRSLARCVADAAGIAAQPVDVAARRSAGFDLGVPGVKVRLQGPDEEASQLDRQTFHRGCAEQMYTGLASFVRAEHDSLDAARARRPPELSATTVGPVPRFSNRTPEQELVETARCIWPHGKLPIERAPWYCEMFEQVALSDRTVVHLKLRVTVEGDRVVVDGATNVACLRDTLADALRAVGVERVRNEMRLLPEEGRLGERRFGVCVVSMALTHAEPCETADLRTQLLYGEPLLLLDHDSGHYLLHGGDGYWGWGREECVRVLTGGEFKRYSVAKRAVLLRDVDLSDRRVVRGAILPVASSRGNTMTLMQPDGTRLDVAAEDIRVVEASKLSGDRVRRALSLLHRPYVFGAVSPMGLDCSGLVRNVCEQTGSTVARDAAQQFLQGRLVATRWYRDDIRPGDLLFFVNPTGKVFHVGIAISATHFVHCAPPEVKINSLRKGDRLYCEYRDRTFLAARRL